MQHWRSHKGGHWGYVPPPPPKSLLSIKDAPEHFIFTQRKNQKSKNILERGGGTVTAFSADLFLGVEGFSTSKCLSAPRSWLRHCCATCCMTSPHKSRTYNNFDVKVLHILLYDLSGNESSTDRSSGVCA